MQVSVLKLKIILLSKFFVSVFVPENVGKETITFYLLSAKATNSHFSVQMIKYAWV